MKLNKRYFSWLAYLVFFALSAMIIFYITNEKDRSLKRNMAITVGSIYDITSLRGSPFQANYRFIVKNETIQNRESIIVDADLQFLKVALAGVKLVVVYDSLDYKNSKLLLSNRDYDQFSLKPDTSVLNIFKRIDRFRIGKDAD